jgi:hypothetical protein
MGPEGAADGTTATHNQVGCPYLNQTGYDAVQDWAHVLARIDPHLLSVELQVELLQLQLGCSTVEPSKAVR